MRFEAVPAVAPRGQAGSLRGRSLLQLSAAVDVSRATVGTATAGGCGSGAGVGAGAGDGVSARASVPSRMASQGISAMSIAVSGPCTTAPNEDEESLPLRSGEQQEE